MRKAAILIAAAAAAGTAAIAQSPTPVQDTKIGPGNDPNQVICIREAEIGSRLATRRVCRTRQEWEEARQQFRDRLDRAQQQSQTQF